jgi:predicted amidophosphoribosyltransferase
LEYIPRQQGPRYSSTNDLILNLKKSVERKEKPEYRYKQQAILTAGNLLRSVLNDEWLPTAVLVPVPCSKSKDDPLYDDRVLQVLTQMTRGLPCDVRELVVQTESLESFHDGYRLTPVELRGYYEIDENLCDCDEPREVTLFDDLLTTGSHFKASKSVIQERWPGVPVSGIFIARRYIPHDEM